MNIVCKHCREIRKIYFMNLCKGCYNKQIKEIKQKDGHNI
jgi:hypothetical protein